SLLTQHPGHMRWLMQEVRKQNNLYLVDSYTTKTSILQKIADENWVPNLRRDVFLDSDRDPAKIRMHFRRLLKMARKTGIALAIGHPYPETMAVLEEELPKLSSMGIQLIPVSKLLNRDNKRFKTWRASLSR
ncbi:MAG: divergent polysaccharide deacetylase family protein, partial [Gammaproteobacteria bacterium]|nr:divergent polysaccharide deacetylase family protein [Gammaproteobacteria bacterium]